MAQPMDLNGDFTELWIQKVPSAGAISIAGYSHENAQLLFIADLTGQVRPLTLGPPDWTWNWRDPIAEYASITGLAAYYHPADGHHHCFIAEATGSIWEVAFTSLAAQLSVRNTWIGGWQAGARGIAGFSGPDGSQHLFVSGLDGLVHPLELSSATGWVWSWRDPVTSFHDNSIAIAAYFHPTDNAKHVFVALLTGDIWESVIGADGTWTENWLGIQDGGTRAFAGHSAANGTQHLFGAGATGWVLPLQIGPPYWKWRWDNRLMARHDGIVGLISYFHPLDNVQHVFAALDTGDIWESRFHLRDRVATREWNPDQPLISYWYGPGDDYPQYQKVAESGMNFMLGSNSTATLESNRNFLATAGTLGLKAIVQDGTMLGIRLPATALTAQDEANLQTLVDNYSGHSAFAGYLYTGSHGTDEIFPDELEITAAIVQFMRKNDPGHFVFAEILPGDSPEYYLDTYVKTVKPTILCWNNYGLLDTQITSFYTNLRMARESAFAQQIPFGQYVSSSQFGVFALPTAEQIRCQAMQVLAFGGTAVLWFTYLQTDLQGFGSAMVDDSGTPTPQYFEVQQVNKDIQTVGAFLVRAQNIAVYELGMGAQGGQPPPANATVTQVNADDLTIGIFSTSPVPNSSSATNFYIMAANRRVDEIRLFTLKFRALTLEQLDISAGLFTPVTNATVSGSHILYEFSIAAGGAQLFRIFSPVGPFPL